MFDNIRREIEECLRLVNQYDLDPGSPVDYKVDETGQLSKRCRANLLVRESIHLVVARVSQSCQFVVFKRDEGNSDMTQPMAQLRNSCERLAAYNKDDEIFPWLRASAPAWELVLERARDLLLPPELDTDD